MSSEEITTRTKILQATLAQLETGPTKMPRMSDIAKRADISRQALYLHFENRTDLLIEATRYQDQTLDVDTHLAPSRAAQTGRARLETYVICWANYIPLIWSVARALMTLSDTEPEAKAALDQRMQDVREGFTAAVDMLARDGDLAPGLDADKATDMLATVLSFRTYEALCIDKGWAQDAYAETMLALAKTIMLGQSEPLTQALTQTPH